MFGLFKKKEVPQSSKSLAINANSDFVYKKLQLNGFTLDIAFKKAPDSHPGWVESQIFRSQLTSGTSTFKADPILFSPADMVFEEVEFLINECRNKPLGNPQTMFDAVGKLCANHIKQCGRLIDNDLESYIDRILTVIYAVSKAEGDELSLEDALKLREVYRNNLLKAFFSYIFISKRDYTGRTTVVKLADDIKK